MAKRKEVQKQATQQKKSDNKEGSGAILSFQIRCKKVGNALASRHPKNEDKIKMMFDFFSEFNPEQGAEVLESILEEKENHHDIGRISKQMSDEFARSKGDDLKRVREEGHKSLRDIASRFNDLEVESFYGGRWSHTTVKNLIHRRRELGLE